MANVLIDENILQEWAQTIRTIKGTSEKMFPSALLSNTKTLSNGEPQEITSAADMESLLTAENVGKVYLYTGETTEEYINGDIYVVEEV